MRGISVIFATIFLSCTLPDNNVKPVVINVTISGDESTYRVIYYLNGATYGDLPIDNNKYKQGDIITIQDGSNLRKGDQQPGCWISAPDGTGTLYDFNQLVILGANNLELYAHWSE